MTLGGNIRTELLSAPDVVAIASDHIFQNHVPTVDERSGWPAAPYIWFRRSGTEDHDCLDQPQGVEPWREFFDIECCAPQVGEELALADAVKSALHYLKGQIGNQVIAMATITDHADDYIARNFEADAGLNIAALQLRIFTGA